MNSKMIFRRILGILLVGLLVLGISACGKKGKEATTTALNVVTTEATTAATTEATEATTEATESTTEATESTTEVTTEATTEAKKEEVTEEKTEEPTEEETEAAADEELLDKDGTYTSKEDVALYIHQYGELPSNFITKKEAKKLGWSGGSLEKYAPGKSIGGDTFGNREGILPDYGTYHECDIDTKGKKERGAKRIVYSDDGRVYYTGDHYETFELLYGEER